MQRLILMRPASSTMPPSPWAATCHSLFSAFQHAASDSRRLSVLDRVLEHTEVRDLQAYRVPRLEDDCWLAREAHAGGRTGGDQVTRRQRQKLREIAHQVAHVEDEIPRIA